MRSYVEGLEARVKRAENLLAKVATQPTLDIAPCTDCLDSFTLGLTSPQNLMARLAI